jgi:hypothetical protein
MQRQKKWHLPRITTIASDEIDLDMSPEKDEELLLTWSNRGATEEQQRSNRGATEEQQRSNRGATEEQQRSNRGATDEQSFVKDAETRGKTL